MTFGKAAAVTAGLAGAFALGVVAGPEITDGWRHDSTHPTAAVEKYQPAPEASKDASTARPRARANRAAPAGVETSKPADVSKSADSSAPAASTMTASDPDLHVRLKRVLRSGAKMDVASEGFRSGEQFASVAHASRNTDVPFMLLKHRVVDEGKSLEAAIKESKPDIDATAEAARARDQAREDIGSLTSAN